MRLGLACPARWAHWSIAGWVLWSIAAPGAWATQGFLTAEVVSRLSSHYVDSEALQSADMLRGALERVSEAYPGVLFTAKGEGNRTEFLLMAEGKPLAVSAAEAESVIATGDSLIAIRSFLARNLRDRPDPAGIETALLEGILEAADRHTQLFTPRAYREFMAGLSGKIGGIGLMISLRRGQLIVDEVLPGTPGERAGIRPGERIAEIGPRFADDLSIQEAVERLRGEPGDPVELGIAAPGETVPRRVEIVRAEIPIPAVESRLFQEAGGRTVGYLRLRIFQNGVSHQLRDRLEDWAREQVHPTGLILDLRGNPGGALQEAGAVADLFLGGGVIVKTKRAGRWERTVRASSSRRDAREPLVVLVDGQSASASEIVAGALKAHGRAVLMGARTFGKGTVQSVFGLSRGYALKLTIAKYLTPGDRSIHGIGVTPHIALRSLSAEPERFRLRETAPERPQDAELRVAESSGAGPPEAPLAVLHVLEADSAPDDGSGAQRALESPAAKSHGGDPAQDTAVALARRILLAHGEGDSKGLTETALRTVEEEARRQDQRLRARLAVLGLDWRSAGSAGAAEAPALVLESWSAEPLDDGGNPAEAFRAGGRVRIAVRVRNAGTVPAARVLVTISGRAGLEPVELPIGWLAPGAAAERSAEFTLPRGAPGPVESLTAALLSEARDEVSRHTALLPLAEVAPPRFAARIGFEEIGDGDGRLAPGETLAMHIAVDHLGGAPSPGGRLLIEATEGRLTPLTPTHRTLPPLEPGMGWEAESRFAVAAGAGDSIPALTLRFRDGHPSGPRLVKRIAVPLGEPLPTAHLSPPEIELLPFADVSRSGVLRIEGRVRDDESPRDVFVRVNGHKVFFRASDADEDGMDLTFAAALPLEDGLNAVMIEGRDHEQLVSRRRFAVWKGEADELFAISIPLPGPAAGAARR
ncbi:MAG: S41 family peptidase [SAR324 cluster bacterium]|nr:S41 family peptidase [SAR324 cluster bacterium]